MHRTPLFRLIPTLFILVPIFALTLIAGCASTPRESIELSATIGRDLQTVHQANRDLALLHFRYLLDDVDRFVEEVYRPFIIEQTVAELELVGQFEAALDSAHPQGLDPLDILVVYTEEVTAQIDRFRSELRAPLLARRDTVLHSIDRAFGQLQTANAVVTGHLASIARVHDAQAGVLHAAGLDDYRQQVATGVAELSDQVQRLLEEARRGTEQMDSLPGRIRDLVPGDPGDGGLQP